MGAFAPYVFPMTVGAAACLLLYAVRAVLLPFVLALGVAFLLNPVIRVLEVRGLRRGPVVLAVFFGLMAIFTLGVYRGAVVAAREAEEAAVRMPFYVAKGQRLLDHWKLASLRAHTLGREKTFVEKSAILRALFLSPDMIHQVESGAREWPDKILHRMPSVAVGLLPFLELVLLVPFLAFFCLWEGPRLREAVLLWLPSRYVEMALNLFVELDNSLGRYLRGIFLEALCMGILAYSGFRVIGLDYSLQIALVAGIANLVPYMGPLISGVAALGAACLQPTGPELILHVLLVCLLLRLADDVIIQPTVLRQAVHLHPVWIIFSLMAGAHLYGFWGLLFGVPVACTVKVLLEVFSSWYRSHYSLGLSSPYPEISRIPLI